MHQEGVGLMVERWLHFSLTSHPPSHGLRHICTYSSVPFHGRRVTVLVLVRTKPNGFETQISKNV